MRLNLARHPITELSFGDETVLNGTGLSINEDELRAHLLEDVRLDTVGLDLVRPGENCRVGPVFDIIEPRAKADGGSPDFPGVLSPAIIARLGTTHVLEGAAVTLVDCRAEISARSARRSILEMSGDAAKHSPYSALQHLVLTPRAKPDMPSHSALNATRMAGLKAAVYMAQAARDQKPLTIDVMGPVGPNEPGREGLHRVAYIGQIYSRQRTPEIDEHIFYGLNTTGMVPVLTNPNEWLDGAVLPSYDTSLGGAETYFYQNHPVITDLYRRHNEGELNFVGVVASISGLDNEDRDRLCQIAAHLVKWGLNADAAVLTKHGGGVPHADMAETARLLEGMEVSTAVMVSDMSRDRRVESALLFNFPEVDAIVYCGGGDTKWTIPAVERIIAGNPQVDEMLAQPQEIMASSIAGVVNQQGASHVRAMTY